MRPSRLLLATTRRVPALGRALLRLVLDDRMPRRVLHHWVVDALLQQQPPDRPLWVRHLGVRTLVPSASVDDYVRSAWEPMTSARLAAYLRPGMTFVDVGAHLGHYTLLAARAVRRSGRVIALEPSPDTVRLLRATVRANAFSHVTVLPVAAGKVAAHRRFHLPRRSMCHGLFPHPACEGERAATTTVKVAPLDLLVTGPVHVVKIDVEGAEPDVLAGMERIISENPHLVLVAEWNPRCLISAGARADELPGRLRQLGFRNLLVLDAGHQHDPADRPLSVEHVLRNLHEGRLPAAWYGNLWAERGQP